MRRPRVLLLTVFVSAWATAAGCVKHSDEFQADAQVYSCLHEWGEYIAASYEAGLAVHECGSLQEAVAYLQKNGILETRDVERLSVDYWGRPYRWSAFRSGGDIVIRVLSDGRDGVCDGGGGDDLYVDVTVGPSGSTTRYVKPYR